MRGRRRTKYSLKKKKRKMVREVEGEKDKETWRERV